MPVGSRDEAGVQPQSPNESQADLDPVPGQCEPWKGLNGGVEASARGF